MINDFYICRCNLIKMSPSKNISDEGKKYNNHNNNPFSNFFYMGINHLPNILYLSPTIIQVFNIEFTMNVSTTV